jgi:hypothetical protein
LARLQTESLSRCNPALGDVDVEPYPCPVYIIFWVPRREAQRIAVVLLLVEHFAFVEYTILDAGNVDLHSQAVIVPAL